MTESKINRYFRRTILPIIAICSALAATACGGGGDDEGGGAPMLEIKLASPQVAATSTTQFIEIETPGQWAISFEYDGEATDWCTAVPPSGKGSTKTAYITYTKNRSEEPRTAIVTVSSDGMTKSADMVQLGINDGDPEDQPDPNPDPTPDGDYNATTAKWLELPTITTKANELVVAHGTTLKDGKGVRNYSMLFDKKERIAYWVAYPLSKDYLVKVTGRTDKWAFDPLIPAGNQMQGTVPGYDRGHQLPSADRVCSKNANNQTFYYSNMTPQLSELNQKMWAALEGQVRGYATACDTLYVVTGAILKTVGGSESVKYVNSVAIPNYYFKVLLRLKAGNYDAIGFWFEQKGYGSGNAGAAQARKVDEIEQLTGYNFFANLPEATQTKIENELIFSAWGLK